MVSVRLLHSSRNEVWSVMLCLWSNLGGLYLAPYILGGLHWSPGGFLESTWTPGTFFFSGSTAKFMVIIHLEFIWSPPGVQVNQVELVESTCQIAVLKLPGLQVESI
jgi:hypothetical protein